MKHSKEKISKKNNKKNEKEEKDNKKTFKSRFIKFIIFALILTLLALISFLSYKAYTFKTLAKEMLSNAPSVVFDSNKETISKIGTERNRQNVNLTDIPDDLKNAYIAIEDQRFYKHHGVDIKRTTAAVFSYVLKRGSSLSEIP